MKNNSILISGITGFVGSNLKPYLEKSNYKIIGVSRQDGLKSGIISYEKCNLDIFNKSIAFVHLAGKAHDLKKVASDKEYFMVNTELTKLLFDKFLESDCEVFIFMSSVKAVRDKVDEVLYEDVTPSPKTVYGKSKLKAEEYIQSIDIPDNKKVYILRPCMIHGPNNKGNLNLLYNIIKKGVPYPLGSYKNKKSFLSVDNLCFVIDKLIDKKPISGVYNVADDKVISTIELVSVIAETISKQSRILNTPKVMINLLARFGDILPLLINTERLKKLTEDYVVSNSKIKDAIGENLPLTIKKGIQKTIHSFPK